MTRLLTSLMGRLPVGWLQLTHNRARLAAAVAGVAFANVLVFVQLGIMGSMNNTILRGYEMLNADIMISADDANTMTEGANVARQWMFQALADPDVVQGAAFYTQTADWTYNSSDISLQFYAVEPDRMDFLHSDIARKTGTLTLPDIAILDYTLDDVEPEVLSGIRPQTPLPVELQGRAIHFADTFEGGASFSANGYAITSAQTFLQLFPQRSAGAPDHILLRTTRGADPEVVSARLQETLGNETLRIRPVMTAGADDQLYQTTERPTGLIFGFGVVMGILVGIVIVYQVLSTDVADHLSEYATFKAMGYNQSFFLGVVFEEALVLAILGFIPGTIISILFYQLLTALTGLPLIFDISLAIAVLLGTLAACTLSGAIATRRLASADPADLF